MEAGLYIPPRLAACMTASPCESGDLRPVRTHGDESRITQGPADRDRYTVDG